MTSPQAPASPVAGKASVRHVVLAGNPNSGKTTLFNALTGMRAKVGNYAGVTVERKEGRLLGAPKATPVVVLDLPGTYSLSPQSLDEQISRDVLFHRLAEVPPPDLVIVVVDASNLQRNLYFATQVIELGYPTLLALNMVDVARENGHAIDAERLAHDLGVPVLPLVASTGEGLEKLRAKILAAGPRAGQFLIAGAKALAAMDGRPAINIDDIRRVAIPVLRHRVSTNFQAQAEGVTPETVIQRLIAEIPEPKIAKYE